MYREIVQKLEMWKSKNDRKPLILNGARQVGKTYILKEFARTHYKKMVYISCDNDSEVNQIFEQDFNIPRIILALSAHTDTTITPNDTLIFFDEIQESPRILNALKYFCENASEYHVAVAGSLLGISLHSGTSFPVGKVEIINMYPMTFNEFLVAMDKPQLVTLQQENHTDVISTLSNSYINLLRQYFFVGGMPEVVKSFTEERDLIKVREIQKNILFNYGRDFSKHAPAREIPRINMIWNTIPSQLAKENKKFTYGAIKKGARAAEFEIALQWLIDAGLVYRIPRATSPQLPLKFYEENAAFKLFLLDVGLMGAMTDMPSSSVLVNDHAFTEYKGAFTELFVLSQLMPKQLPIYYYSANNSVVEIDFLVQHNEQIIPIEVKATVNVKSKSLRTYIDKHPQLKGLRLSMLPYVDQNWMENKPLYAPETWLS